MKATRPRRLCPTCGSPIRRGPGRYTYCSDLCRPICVHPTCEKPARGGDNVCASHQVMRKRYGELRPDTWTKDWVCVVCGKDVEKGSGRRKHCSAACQQLDYQHRGNRPKSRTCKLCGREFSLLVKSGARIQRTDTQWCPDCGRESPEVKRMMIYGVTPDAYAAALVRGCDICGERTEKLHVDHDHSCCPARGGSTRICGKCVRGFLCGPCNRALGMMKDDPSRLRRAADYLDENTTHTN